MRNEDKEEDNNEVNVSKQEEEKVRKKENLDHIRLVKRRYAGCNIVRGLNV
jgi:hypothetical protein